VNDNCVSIAREVTSPLNESVTFVFTRSNREAANRTQDRGVLKLWLSRDDREGDIVVNRLIG